MYLQFSFKFFAEMQIKRDFLKIIQTPAAFLREKEREKVKCFNFTNFSELINLIVFLAQKPTKKLWMHQLHEFLGAQDCFWSANFSKYLLKTATKILWMNQFHELSVLTFTNWLCFWRDFRKTEARNENQRKNCEMKEADY